MTLLSSGLLPIRPALCRALCDSACCELAHAFVALVHTHAGCTVQCSASNRREVSPHLHHTACPCAMLQQLCLKCRRIGAKAKGSGTSGGSGKKVKSEASERAWENREEAENDHSQLAMFAKPFQTSNTLVFADALRQMRLGDIRPKTTSVRV